MDPQQLMMLQMMLQQQGGGPRGHPLASAFGGTPMYGGVPILPSQMFDLSGIPGFQGNTPMGMMIGMMMQGILPGLMGPNFTPGQFAPTQNMFDHRYALHHFMQRRRAIETSSKADIETYFRIIRGMARMRGIEYEKGGEQEQSAYRFAKDISVITPILGDVMPDLLDQMHGIRGSSQMLARSMFEAGRYQFDPASGRLGVSGESAGAMSAQIFEQLYGPGADITKMRGLGAGRMGQVYDQLVKRGFGVPAALDERESRMQLQRELSRRPGDIQSTELRTLRRQMLGDTGRGETDTKPLKDAFDELGKGIENLNPQAFEAAQRSFNATRTAQMLKSMSGAVSAMRDIFGDMGRPNAPMIELINGLQAMTQGGLSHMTSSQIEKSVRETYAIAKYTGLGIEGILGFAGTAGQALDVMGRNRAFAPQIAASSALYGFAFGQSGQPTNFGVMDREHASQLDMRLRLNTLQSGQVSRLAAVMRFADEFVQANGTVGFDKTKEAYALSEAIRAGASTYNYGGRKDISIFQSAQDVQRILQEGGVGRNDAGLAVIQDPAAAQKWAQRYNLQDLLRSGQGRLDFEPIVGTIFANAAGMSLTDTNMDPNKRQQVAGSIGQTLIREARKLFDENPNLFDAGQERARNAALAGILQKQLPGQLQGISTAQLTNLVGTAFDRGEAFVQMKGSPLGAYGSLLGGFQIHSARTEQLAQRTRAETQGIVRVQTALSSAGQAGLVARLSDFTQNVGPGGGTFQDLLFTALGGLPTGEIADAAQGLLERMSNLQLQLQELPRSFPGNIEKQKTEEARILAEIRELGPVVAEVLQGRMPTDPNAKALLQRVTTPISGFVTGGVGVGTGVTAGATNIQARQAQNRAVAASLNLEKAQATGKEETILAARQEVTEAYKNLNDWRRKLGLRPAEVPTAETIAVAKARANLRTVLDAEVGKLPDVKEAQVFLETAKKEAAVLDAQAKEGRGGATEDLTAKRLAAGKKVTEATKYLEERIGKAGASKDVRSMQTIIKARAALQKALDAVGPSKETAMRDVNLRGTNVNVNSQNVTVTAAAHKRSTESPEDALTAALTPQYITGTLEIKGLHEALLEAQGKKAPISPRST